ncbi:MAG: DEAD/DEAH box helicase [Bdellovibrionota bacterium]
MTAFTNFNLLPTLQATLSEKGFTSVTEIQGRALPRLLDGKSVVGVSETGSGKTLAYALPILHHIKSLELDSKPVTVEGQPRAVVIVPTRDLGEQISKVFKPFTHTTRVRVRTVLGGTEFDVAKRNVSGMFEILVATPGRLVQLLDRKLVNLSDVRILVFDEADQMLDQGFLPDAKRIASECPADRQLALFSATVTAPVQTLMKDLFASAEVVRSGGSHRVVASLKTINRTIEDGKRFPVLEALLDKDVKGGTLVFVNTREQCDKLAALLKASGREALIYRGEMDKVQRRTNLKTFREGKVGVLIATDVASRGLDIEHVGRVVNYHMPQQMENYIHRVGRTARAGREGVVINFVTERDLPFVEKLESIQ